MVLDYGTIISEIEAGVGYIENETPEEGQSQIDDAATVTDVDEQRSVVD